uniref:Uncharacterized protein n=1 Tax=Rhizophagus irregularis (strain DAOM 181602 / DAOM 197198 / MUCL 43194) TaxID=747089 RepID=U9STB4_RHIID
MRGILVRNGWAFWISLNCKFSIVKFLGVRSYSLWTRRFRDLFFELVHVGLRTLLLPKPLQLRIWRLFGSGYLDINVTNISFKLIEKNKNGITSTSNLKLLE